MSGKCVASSHSSHEGILGTTSRDEITLPVPSRTRARKLLTRVCCSSTHASLRGGGTAVSTHIPPTWEKASEDADVAFAREQDQKNAACADDLFYSLAAEVLDRSHLQIALAVPTWLAQAFGPGVKEEWISFVHAFVAALGCPGVCT